MTKRFFPESGRAVGWHGKLPTVGDFASRRLNSDFVGIWDMWLSSGLASLRDGDPDHWLDDYLVSPTWRFLLTPGFLPSPLQASYWVGIVMPSVDRVGRYYPLTLATPLSAMPVTTDGQSALWGWLHRLEDAAVGALEEDWSIDMLETELIRLDLPPEPALIEADPSAPRASHPFPMDLSGVSPMERFFTACLSMPCSLAGGTGCCWFSQTGIAEPRILFSSCLDETIEVLWRN